MGYASVFFWNLEKIKLKLKVLRQIPLLARYAECSMFNIQERFPTIR